MTVQEALLSARCHAGLVGTEERLDFAHEMVSVAIDAYWNELYGGEAYDWFLCEVPSHINFASLSPAAEEVALTIGLFATRMDVNHASYTIGLLYTGLMPAGLRAKLGAYYTPPALCGPWCECATGLNRPLMLMGSIWSLAIHHTDAPRCLHECAVRTFAVCSVMQTFTVFLLIWRCGTPTRRLDKHYARGIIPPPRACQM